MSSEKPVIFLTIVILQWMLLDSTTPVDDVKLADASPTLLVSHYDCSKPKNMRMFSTTEVKDCEVQPEDLQYNKVKLRMYTKNSATKVDAYVCSVNYKHDRWYCGMHSHSSNDATHSSITSPLLITSAQCKEVAPDTANPTHTVHLQYSGLYKKEDVQINFKLDQFVKSVENFGNTIKDTGNDCKGYGWIERFTFLSYVQKVTINYDNEAKTVVGIDGLTLPCPYSSGGCDSTGLGRYAYTWETDDTCILTHLKTDTTEMVKWEDRYFIINDPEVTKKYKAARALYKNIDSDDTFYKFEVFPGLNRVCLNGDELMYSTNSKVLYIVLDRGGFDPSTGELLPYGDADDSQEYVVNINEIYGGAGLLAKSADKSKTEFPHFTVQMNLKNDYMIHKNSELIRNRALEVAQQICNLEQMLMLNVLQVARIDASQAGYILTRNRSTFLETDGAIAWIYSCEKRISPLMRLTSCHNYIPILYTGTTMFVDPITRIALTKELAPEIPCAEAKDMPFHLDLDDDESWYKLVPFPAPTIAPLKFSPKIIRQSTPFHTYSSVQAGIYNQKDLENFWTRLQLGIREDGILKVLVQQLTYDRYSKQSDGSPNFE